MLAGDNRQSHYGVFVHSDQATGLQYATIFPQMMQDGDGLVLWKFAVKQRSAFAFREAVLTSAAGQHASLLGGTVTEANAQIVLVALTVVWAFGVLAAEDFQVVHGNFSG